MKSVTMLNCDNLPTKNTVLNCNDGLSPDNSGELTVEAFVIQQLNFLHSANSSGQYLQGLQHVLDRLCSFTQAKQIILTEYHKNTADFHLPWQTAFLETPIVTQETCFKNKNYTFLTNYLAHNSSLVYSVKDHNSSINEYYFLQELQVESAVIVPLRSQNSFCGIFAILEPQGTLTNSEIISLVNAISDCVVLLAQFAHQNQQLQKKLATSQKKLAAAKDVLYRSSESIYTVDLTDGLLLEDYVNKDGMHPVRAVGMTVPCNYDQFLQQVLTILEAEFIDAEMSKTWNATSLLDKYQQGITSCEAEYKFNVQESYHHLNGLMSQNEDNGHVILTVISTDVTQQRNEQIFLQEAHSFVEKSNALLQEKQAELEEKHAELAVAFNELQEYNSIIRGLQSVFDTCYFFDLAKNEFIEVTSDKSINKYFKHIHTTGAAVRAYIEKDVPEQYWSVITEFYDPTTISARLEGKPYITCEFHSNTRGWIKGYIIPAQYNQNSEITHCLYASEIIDEEKRKHNHLIRIAETDGLTNINNRIAGEKRITNLIIKRTPGFFGILDCDKFKTINDTYGHKAGDKVLVAIAGALRESFTGNNIIMRLGGDEFAFFIPLTQLTEFQTLVHRFFTVLEAIHIPDLHGHEFSISIGATYFDGIGNTTFEEVYDEADRHLYESKKYLGNYLTCK